ncbi:hypothetical protein [Halosimplex salinum]|uniref:hypothetical protein n=1 Tax=Halosimplex salinum TaxID=1710538 RepID=UPI000F489EA4|nr:hypothetical protein [Halosimplex salinum]
MDVALLKQGGIYSVTGESGETYTIDLIDETCTCPDYQDRDPEGGCKHVRRVAIEVEEETVPRPDGKLPSSAFTTSIQEDDDNDVREDADYQQAEAAIIDAIQDREEEIARLQSEIEALEFVTDTLEAIRNPDEDFGLDAIRDQR